jgi:hypothetical protein
LNRLFPESEGKELGFDALRGRADFQNLLVEPEAKAVRKAKPKDLSHRAAGGPRPAG